MPDDLANHPMIRRLLDQIQQLETRVAFAEARVADQGTPFGRLVLVKRSGGTEGKQFKEQTVVEGTIVEFEDGRQCDSDDDDAALIAPVDAEFVVEFEDKDSVRYVPMTNWVRVTLTEDGTGTDGSQTTAASWKYTAAVGGNEIGRDLTPETPVRTNGKRVRATAGWCYRDSDGLKLALCNESPTTGTC